MKFFKTFFTLSVVALTGCVLAIAGNKTYNSKADSNEINVSRFSGLSVSGNIKVKIIPGNSYKAVIHTDAATFKNVNFKQRGEMLNIGLKNQNSWNNGKVTVTVTAPVINDISLSGASKVECESPMNFGNRDAHFSCSGSSKIELDNIVCKDINIMLSGSSSVEIDKLKCNDISAQASGNSEIEIDHINADNVNAAVSGASKIDLEGKADNVNFSASGASVIDANELKAYSGVAGASGASVIKCAVSGKFSQKTSGNSVIKNRP